MRPEEVTTAQVVEAALVYIATDPGGVKAEPEDCRVVLHPSGGTLHAGGRPFVGRDVVYVIVQVQAPPNARPGLYRVTVAFLGNGISVTESVALS
jgi:hypothetical protein